MTSDFWAHLQSSVYFIVCARRFPGTLLGNNVLSGGANASYSPETVKLPNGGISGLKSPGNDARKPIRGRYWRFCP